MFEDNEVLGNILYNVDGRLLYNNNSNILKRFILYKIRILYF